MTNTNPDEQKVQLAEIVNNTPVKRRIRRPEIEKCYVVESDECVELDLIDENTKIMYRENVELSDMREESETYFTDGDVFPADSNGTFR
ncbi:hypothetical protein ECANGB1_838 [Enterospora canceri]|uniref:Uncharacterized protein n=1 Tax=Enterospora canceri TaxID=1081671 RepID=A0A1Y1S849_9MICR|nr:hypothetical protein ECANGB1_838 [Enterospora canceri]